MKKIVFFLLLSVATLGFKDTQALDLSVASVCPDNLIYIPGVRQNEQQGIGYHHGYTTAEMMVISNSQCDCMTPFLDLRAHHFDNNKFAANVGLGARYFSNCLSKVFGANVYYDYRQTSHARFNQMGVGLEMLGPYWSLRANGYLPIGRLESHPQRTVFDQYLGGYVITRTERHVAMYGADAELEVFLGRLGQCRFYAGVGPYYLSQAKGPCHNTVGGQFRVTADYNEYLSVEVFVSSDRIYDTITQGQVAFRIPFGCECEDSCNDCCSIFRELMIDPVRRHEIIATHKRCSWMTNF